MKKRLIEYDLPLAPIAKEPAREKAAWILMNGCIVQPFRVK
jgi:hypothetical protein